MNRRECLLMLAKLPLCALPLSLPWLAPPQPKAAPLALLAKQQEGVWRCACGDFTVILYFNADRIESWKLRYNRDAPTVLCMFCAGEQGTFVKTDTQAHTREVCTYENH